MVKVFRTTRSAFAALQMIPPPPTGAALQLFLCALNWLRDSMVDLSRTVAPLQEKLEKVMRERGRRKFQLCDAKLTWSSDERVAFQEAFQMVKRLCKLIFPDKDAVVCMFSDASLTGYSIVIHKYVAGRRVFLLKTSRTNLLFAVVVCIRTLN